MEFTIQYVQNLIGSSSSAATLTAAYAGNASAVFPIGGMHSVVVYVQYTPKAGQSNRILYMQVELGPEADDLYLMTKRTDVSSSDALLQRYQYVEEFVGATGGVTYKERFAIGDIADKFFKVSFKEDGIADFGTLYAKMTYSGK